MYPSHLIKTSSFILFCLVWLCCCFFFFLKQVFALDGSVDSSMGHCFICKNCKSDVMVNSIQHKKHSVVMTKAPFAACPPHIRVQDKWVFQVWKALVGPARSQSCKLLHFSPLHFLFLTSQKSYSPAGLSVHLLTSKDDCCCPAHITPEEDSAEGIGTIAKYWEVC